MKRFHFSLRPVAVLRAHREVRAREAFAGALNRLALAEDALLRVGVRMRALEAALATGRATSFRAAEAALLLSDYRRECAAESQAEAQVEAARVDMRKFRAAYLEAHRELEVVNRLEVKSRDVHRREGLREEQSELDELAGQRHQQPLTAAS